MSGQDSVILKVHLRNLTRQQLLELRQAHFDNGNYAVDESPLKEINARLDGFIAGQDYDDAQSSLSSITTVNIETGELYEEVFGAGDGDDEAQDRTVNQASLAQRKHLEAFERAKRLALDIFLSEEASLKSKQTRNAIMITMVISLFGFAFVALTYILWPYRFFSDFTPTPLDDALKSNSYLLTLCYSIGATTPTSFSLIYSLIDLAGHKRASSKQVLTIVACSLSTLAVLLPHAVLYSEALTPIGISGESYCAIYYLQTWLLGAASCGLFTLHLPESIHRKHWLAFALYLGSTALAFFANFIEDQNKSFGLMIGCWISATSCMFVYVYQMREGASPFTYNTEASPFGTAIAPRTRATAGMTQESKIICAILTILVPCFPVLDFLPYFIGKMRGREKTQYLYQRDEFTLIWQATIRCFEMVFIANILPVRVMDVSRKSARENVKRFVGALIAAEPEMDVSLFEKSLFENLDANKNLKK